MSMSLTSASSRHLVYCSSDKKSYVIDDYEKQARFAMKGSKGKYDFVMKDGTKNTLQRALRRLNPANKFYFSSRFNLSEISLESAQAENLMVELYNRDIISEDEMNEYTFVDDGLVPLPKNHNGHMGMAEDEPNIYQAFKQLAAEKEEKAKHLKGEEKEVMSKKAEMYSRLAGILKSIFGEVQGTVSGVAEYHKRLEELNPPGLADGKSPGVVKNFLDKARDEINDSLDKMVTPSESAEEKRRRLKIWERERLFQEIRGDFS